MLYQEGIVTRSIRDPVNTIDKEGEPDTVEIYSKMFCHFYTVATLICCPLNIRISGFIGFQKYIPHNINTCNFYN